jgi:hypothetical protein
MTLTVAEIIEEVRREAERKHQVPDEMAQNWPRFPLVKVVPLCDEVDRLTGDNAALSEALDTALLHLKESEADRDKAVTMLGEEAIAHSRTRHERDALAGQLEEQGAEIDRLRRAIEDEYGCVPGEFDPFTFHEGPLFEGMP